MFLTCC